MKKTEFIDILRRTLKANKIQDVEEIIDDYEQHFSNKIADGYTEEEIAAKLGDPKLLGIQFGLETSESTMGNKVITITGLLMVDIIASMLYILICTWVIIISAIVIVSAVTGFLLIFNLNIANLIPDMPYGVSFAFGVMSFALAVLAALGTIYFSLFAKQILLGYCRWHRNTLASAEGGVILPNVPIHPQISAIKRRRIRKIFYIVLIVFVVTLQIGYLIAALIAGRFEFWHVWNWF